MSPAHLDRCPPSSYQSRPSSFAGKRHKPSLLSPRRGPGPVRSLSSDVSLGPEPVVQCALNLLQMSCPWARAQAFRWPKGNWAADSGSGRTFKKTLGYMMKSIFEISTSGGNKPIWTDNSQSRWAQKQF